MYDYCYIKPDKNKYFNCINNLLDNKVDEKLEYFVKNSDIESIKYSLKNDRCILCLNTDFPPANGEVGQLKDYLKKYLSEVKNISLEIKSKHPVKDVSEYLSSNLMDILRELANDYPILKNAFDYNKYDFDLKSNILNIYILSSYFKNLLKKKRLDDYIESFLNKRLNTDLKIVFKISDRELIEKEISDAEKENNNNNMSISTNNSSVSPQKPSVSNNSKNSSNFSNSKGTRFKKSKSGQSIVGPDFDTSESISIQSVIENQSQYNNNFIVVKGKIFFLDKRVIKSEKRDYYKTIFYLDDDTEVIYCEYFGLQFLDLKLNSYVAVKGKFSISTFVKNEPVVVAKSVLISDICSRPDLSEEKRIELHAHSKMSRMDGLIDIKKYVEIAKYWGHKAAAVTDHGNVNIFPDFYKCCSDNDIKPILGLEGYLCQSENNYNKEKSFHISLLVKDNTGLKNLYKLVSLSNLDFFYKTPRIPKNKLTELRTGILVGTACSGGELFTAIINNEPEDKIEEIADFYDYFEIMPVENNNHLIRSQSYPDIQSEVDLQDINKRIYQLGKKLNKIVVATGDIHYITYIDKISRHALHIFNKYKDTDSETLLFFKTTDEMLQEFSYLGKEESYEVVITNTNKINNYIEKVQPIPDGFYPPFIEGSDKSIMEIAKEKLKSIYGTTPPQNIIDRFDKEMNSIIENNYSSLYYLAYKMVKESNDAGYIVGSRGSVGSSFVAYLLNISEVNPLPAHYICPKCYKTDFTLQTKYTCGVDMPNADCPDCSTPYLKDGFSVVFEVFVGFNKDKVPDIDLNFSSKYQSTIHRWVEDFFGKSNVFKAGTISTLKENTVYSVIKSYSEEKGGLTEAKKEKLLQSCNEVKRTSGQHPGGMIIVPKGKEVYDFTPIQYPANKKDSGSITTQFDYHKMEKQLLKLDCLGHDNPTQLKYLCQYTGIKFEDIPVPDEKTTSIFSSCKALGVKPEDIGTPLGTLAIPEFNTDFVRQMLIDTKPASITELINISGLSHGTDVWIGNAKELIKKSIPLSKVITSRDDILNFLTNMGMDNGIAFRIMENVRKGKGLTGEHLSEMKKLNVPLWYVESCQKIKYLFPKAHAIAYVMMAYRIAYFKVHHPVEFYASFINIKAEDINYKYLMMSIEQINDAIQVLQSKDSKELTAKDKKDIYIMEVIREMKARNVVIHSIDLYISEAKDAVIKNNGIYPPFVTLEGLGKEQAFKIVNSRKSGVFKSYEDFSKRTSINQTLFSLMKTYDIFPKNLPKSNHLELF